MTSGRDLSVRKLGVLLLRGLTFAALSAALSVNDGGISHSQQARVRGHRHHLREILGLIQTTPGTAQSRTLQENATLRISEVTVPIVEGLRRAPKGDLALWVLANVGFKDAASGRMRQEYLELQNAEAGIRVPEGRQAKTMRLMRADKAVHFRLEDGYAIVTIPNLRIAEVAHLELA